MNGQVEDLDRKYSSAERQAKGFKEQLEEVQDRLSDETRIKIAGSNKQKHLADEVERLNQQLEDEEEAKNALQSKLMQVTQQVRRGCRVTTSGTSHQRVPSALGGSLWLSAEAFGNWLIR